jgi:uncharacterized protein
VSRPLLLLPPSKGKAPDGSGTGYGKTIGHRHPLAAARREVLTAAVSAASSLSDSEIARVAGVPASEDAAVSAARAALAGLPEAPTLPAHRRYTGIVHGNAGLAALDPPMLEVDVRMVSALLGLVALDEPVPAYRLEFAASLPPLGGLATFWRDHLGAHLETVADGARVWDLLPGEHARMWPPGLREQLDVVSVRFLRPDGRAANAARTKVAKGRLAAWLITTPDADPAGAVAGAHLGEGWSLALGDNAVIATFDL